MISNLLQLAYTLVPFARHLRPYCSFSTCCAALCALCLGQSLAVICTAL